MFIRDLIWDQQNIEHIAAHDVDVDEAEDVCYGSPLIQRVGEGKHALLGQTGEGRYLFVVVAHKGNGVYRVITARDMTESEWRRCAKRK